MNVLMYRIVNNQRIWSTICFSLFSAWLLSLPFEGQVLFSIVQNAGIDGSKLSLSSVLAHFLGLFCCGFFVKRIVEVKMTMIIAIIVCISGSLVFFFPFSVLWYISIVAIAFFAGFVIASWGFYYQKCSKSEERLKTAADVMIFTNIIVILVSILTVSISVRVGLILSIVSLLGALLMAFRLGNGLDEGEFRLASLNVHSSEFSGFFKPLLFLCIFIFIIAINSGLMYEVVVPAFAGLKLLTGYYWIMPYLLALVILRNLPAKVNKAYILFVAMAMIGLSFVSFMVLDRSVASYLVIDTLMLGAFGVCDLFWWSIIGSFLDFSENPAQVFGISLSMNVLGIFVGGLIGNQITASQNDAFGISILAVIIIFAVLIMLPLLNNQLTKLIKRHVFLFAFEGMNESEQEKVVEGFESYKLLTEKETEVVRLLLKGYTYKAISESLNISENTMKFHIKNIYQKFNINSKMELIKVFSNNKNN